MTEQGGADSMRDLDRVLADLRALSGDISSCAVLSGTGALLSSSHGPGADRERAAAMLAAVANVGRRAARGEGKEHASQMRVDTDEGHLLLVRLEDGGALAVTTDADARVGLALYDMRNAREEIERAINGGDDS